MRGVRSAVGLALASSLGSLCARAELMRLWLSASTWPECPISRPLGVQAASLLRALSNIGFESQGRGAKKAQTTLSETTKADHPAAAASFCGAASERPESPLLQRPFAPQSCGTTVSAYPGAPRPRDSAKATRRLYRTREKTKAPSRREGDWGPTSRESLQR